MPSDSSIQIPKSASAAVEALRPVFELMQGGNPDAICAKYSISREELDRRHRDYLQHRERMDKLQELPSRRVGRNEPCPCGSGKKYKKCCLAHHEKIRQSLPADELQEMEERARRQEEADKAAQKAFELLFTGDYVKARRLAEQNLEEYPEDDRLHDAAVVADLATGEYDAAFRRARTRWQVAQEEKAYFQEHGNHKRQGKDKGHTVKIYSPSTWLDKFWIAQRARNWAKIYPAGDNEKILDLVHRLYAANDLKRFPEQQEEGVRKRKEALAPVVRELEAAGPEAVPYLLPLTYHFTWVSLFVPDLLAAYGTDECIRLLCELSMFRFPFFSQECLAHLESFGERALPHIEEELRENPAVDELKAGLVMVLGRIPSERSFRILTELTEHENRYLVNWASESLGKLGDPRALPYLEKARERFGPLAKIAGAIDELNAVARKVDA